MPCTDTQCTCATCGFTWKRGRNGSHSCVPQLEDKIKKLGGDQVALAEAVLLVIKGLRSGSVRSKPVLSMEEGAESFPMVSLEDALWAALNKCGIREAKS